MIKILFLGRIFFFTTKKVPKESLPKSEKVKSRNLVVKNHGGLRN